MKFLYCFNNFLFLKNFYFTKNLQNLNKNFYFLNYWFFQKKKKFLNYKKKNFLQNFFIKFIGIVFKSGLKTKVILKFLIIFNNFFFLFFKKYNFLFFRNYDNYVMINSFFKFILTFNNINFIFDWIFFIIKPVFSIKCLKINKKYQKKFKKKFNFSIIYISNKKRELIALRWLYLNSNNFIGKNYFDRFLKNFLDVFLNGKMSRLFLKKKIILKNYFKKFY